MTTVTFELKLGTTVGNMQTLTDIGVTTAPDVTPVYYSQRDHLGTGGMRNSGWLQAEWRWAYIDIGQARLLRAYCPGESTASAAVYVKTAKTGAGTGVYSAQMVWPQIEPGVGDNCFTDFVIIFQAMVEESTT